MGVSSFVLKVLAKNFVKNNFINKSCAIQNQEKVFKKIISSGSNSLFAKKTGINSKINYDKFRKCVAVSNYEDYHEYISLISQGKKNVLTKSFPKYFAITSGTTSGTKYIPLTHEMWKFQSQAIKELLLLYAYQTNNYNYVGAGMMFLQGSPRLEYFNKVPFGKLSGIAAKHVPFFLKKNRYPSMKTNTISPWDKKINAIVEETWDKDMQIIGGIPPWVITYFNSLLTYTKKNNVQDVFPNLKLYIHGGTSFQSYKQTVLKLCGEIDTLEVYPASEGFFGYQDDLSDPSLLLLTNHGVFYEFIPLENFKKNKMSRIPLEDVSVNVDYVMIVSTVAGLWAYNAGDTVRFVSTRPYKIIFSGRASQYCSAFGEHVIEKEVQVALDIALKKHGGRVYEFSVCPRVGESVANSRHEWFVEFLEMPNDSLFNFETTLNSALKKQNIYYCDLIDSKVMSSLSVFVVKRGGFDAYMKSIGKFGGQNKCPHLLNDRQISNFLLKKYVEN
tara:strand:+ start:4623 stop:6125 length:1503 start_codon:yes stop_codon:yes gene_type:complete